MLVLAAEADIGGPGFRHRDMPRLFPVLVEDSDAIAGQIDISGAVYGHAVASQFAEEAFPGERSIRLDIVGVSLARTDVGDIERFAVRRPDDTVGLFQVVHHTPQFLTIWGKIVNVFALLLFAALPVRALVIGIGKIHTAIGAKPDIVGAVQKLAFIVMKKNGMALIRLDNPHFVLFVGAGP